ncbi:aminoglycoside phosphotransferase family protein [Vibrio sp. S9_S30]|uniref:aminoglycoside phosphotransferase family protein n=1 Tax=Vibrio sp. S9_S30 TaxID=2720226 RepID=UPI001681965A|nr:aminoglycoside phosphotransferase family protein [Vibrio sp. S9_S30]MBD1558164.1 aminoglycoside phosphotransferase family protein [Vibrio sp. S9_S30]
MSNVCGQGVVEARAKVRLGSLTKFENPLVVLASPAWRGVEADMWLAESEDGREIYKHYHADTHHYVHPPQAIEIAVRAGELGVAPLVLDTWLDDGLFAMEYLGEGWHAGGLIDTTKEDVRAEVIKAKKTLQSGPKMPRDATIFAEIQSLYEFCLSHHAILPRHIDAFMTVNEQANQAISANGFDSIPCHRDGNTANLMIGPNNIVKLLDFDLSANTDPFEDIGCYLMEVFEREPEARVGFEQWYGQFDEGLFQRAYIYGVLDDLRWGLIAASMSASSQRVSLEFSKYASWRFMRFEQHSQRSLVADRLRCLS